MQPGFFFSSEEDSQLEETNAVFWDCLLGHIRDDRQDAPPRSVLDIGSHRGGLLARLAKEWQPQRVWGIEPLSSARTTAMARLQGCAPDLQLLDPADWPRVPVGAFDLITCHEVLYLEPDLKVFMARLQSVLTRTGRAYLVLGCHAENPVWATWKPQLEALGHRVHDHFPLDILAAGAAQGLRPALRSLRQSGWISHDPRQSGFSFPSASAMLEHHFKHKLVFRFIRP